MSSLIINLDVTTTILHSISQSISLLASLNIRKRKRGKKKEVRYLKDQFKSYLDFSFLIFKKTNALICKKLTGYVLRVGHCKPCASKYSTQMNTGEMTRVNSTAQGYCDHSAVITNSSQDFRHLLQQDILEKENFSERFLLTNYTAF